MRTTKLERLGATEPTLHYEELSLKLSLPPRHQKNEAFKSIEERRVLCAFASTGEPPVAVLWVRRSETNRPSKCLEDTRGELARKGLTHRRMANDSPKIKWSCQRVNEQVGVGIPRQFSGRDGLLDQV